MPRKPGTTKASFKRYQLVIPNEMWNKLWERAKKEHTTVLQQIIKCVKIGLFLYKAAKKGSHIYIRETRNNETKDTEIIIL